jgi:hypothetical protein
VALLVDALRAGWWKLTSKTQSKVGDRSRIERVYLGHILVFAC